jgi:hypothetical protein
MPYELKKVQNRKYKVCKVDDPSECFSKKGLPKKTAKKQKMAIEISERRKRGGARNTDNFDNDKWNELYTKFKKMAKEAKLDQKYMWDLETFKEDFDRIWTGTTVLGIMPILKDMIIILGEDIVDRKRNETSQTLDEIYEEYQQDLLNHNGHVGTLDELNLDEFTKKYKKYRDKGITNDNTIIRYIIDDQQKEEDQEKAEYKEMYPDKEPDEIEINAEDAEDLADKWYMYLLDRPVGYSVLSDGRKEFGYQEVSILESDDITGSITDNKYVNYNDLKALYDYLKEDLEKAPAYVKKRKAYLVNVNEQDENPMIETLNYIVQKVAYYGAKGSIGNNWCVDKCDGDSKGWDLLRRKDLYMISCYLNNDNKIVFSGGAECSNGGDYLKIDYLCAGNYGFTVFECFKEKQKKGSDYFFDPSSKKYDYLKLWSVSNYLTVEFYWSQGLLNSSDITSSSIEDLKNIIEEKELEKKYPSRYALIEDFIQKIKAGECDVNSGDDFMNNLYKATDCGQNKYYIPKLLDSKNKIIPGSKLPSNTDHINMKEAFLSVLESEKQDERNQKGFEAKERIKERLPKIKRIIELEKIKKGLEATRSERHKKIFEKKTGLSVPTEERSKLEKVNKQLKNAYLELQPLNDGNKSVEFIANKPSFTDIMGTERSRLREKTRRTEINRLKGNDPREEYNRRRLFQSFANDPIQEENIFIQKDPFKTGHLGRRPPPAIPDETKDYYVTKGSGLKGTKFYEELRRYGIKPEDYLKQMKIWAKKSGYDEKQLSLNNNDIHKLRIMTENGTKNFGRVGYKDYYIYRHLEKKKEVPKGTANKMRNRFRKSHEAISKKRKLGRNTPNELSLRILWHENSDDIRR